MTVSFKFVATKAAMTDQLSSAKQGDARPRIMIADKSPVVRSGLRDFINRDGRFEVLEAHATGAAFVAAVEQIPTDIGIIGWSLPDMTGGEVLSALNREELSPTNRPTWYSPAASHGSAISFVSAITPSSVMLSTTGGSPITLPRRSRHWLRSILSRHTMVV